MRFSVLNTQKLTTFTASEKRTYSSVFQKKNGLKTCVCANLF